MALLDAELLAEVVPDVVAVDVSVLVRDPVSVVVAVDEAEELAVVD